MTTDERNKIKDNVEADVEAKGEDYFATILPEVENCLKEHPKPLFHLMDLIIKYRNQARMEILGKMNTRNEKREAEFKKTMEKELRKNNLM